jgi:putative copper export protein
VIPESILVDIVSILKGVTRGLAYASATLLAGVATFETLLLPRLSRRSPAISARAVATTLRLSQIAASVCLLAYLARLYVQVIDSYLVFLPTRQMVEMLLFSTFGWGLGMLTQIVVSAAVVVIEAAGRRAAPAPPRRWTLAIAAVLSVMAVPLTGHAVAHVGLWAAAVQSLHVLGVGGWLGTLAVVALVARRIQTPAEVQELARTFTPIALSAAAILASGGVATLFVHVGSPQELWNSSYGLALVAKVVIFLMTAGAGYANWRHVTPRLIDPAGRRRFDGRVRAELTLGVLALAMTVVLTSLPRPGDE